MNKATDKSLSKAQAAMLATIYMYSVGGRSYDLHLGMFNDYYLQGQYPISNGKSRSRQITLRKQTFELLLDKGIVAKTDNPNGTYYALTPQGLSLGNEVKHLHYDYEELKQSPSLYYTSQVVTETSPILTTMTPEQASNGVRHYLAQNALTLDAISLGRLVSMIKRLEEDSTPIQTTSLATSKERWSSELEQAAWQFAYDQHCEATTNA